MATEFIEISEQEYQGGASDFIEITEEEFNTPQEPVGTSIGQEISQLPAALKQSFGQPLEAMGETAQVAGFPAVATALKGAIQEPEGYVSAGQRFMEPQEGEFQIAGFAPQYAPRAIAEQTGQIIGSIGSRIAGAITLGGLGALINPATGAAGAAAGQFAGPALFEAAQIVGPVALERAKNNGYTEPTNEDMAYAVATAAGSGLLNAFGAKYLPGGEKAVGSFSKRLAASFIGEGIPEGLQSLVQQVGETVETKKGIQVSPKQAVGEALIGGGAGAAATIASAPFTPEQIEEQKITERANKEAENLVIGNDNPQGKAVLANKQKLEQEIADAKQVLSVIESTDPVAQKLKLELKEKEAILAAAQGQVDSIVDSNEPVVEAEKQQIELAKAITEPAPEVVAPVSEVAPEVPAPVTEAITPPAEVAPTTPVAEVAPAPTEVTPTIAETLPVAPEAPAITPAPVTETPAVAPAPEVAPANPPKVNEVIAVDRKNNTEFALVKGLLPERPDMFSIGIRLIGSTQPFESGGYGHNTNKDRIMQRFFEKERTRLQDIEVKNQYFKNILSEEEAKVSEIETQKAAEKIAQEEQQRVFNEQKSSYEEAISKVKLPNGKSETMRFTAPDGSEQALDSTRYGNIGIRKVTSGKKPLYNVDHWHSGLRITQVASLSEAKKLAQAIIASGADISSKDIKESELEKMHPVVRYFVKGESVPQLPAPAEAPSTPSSISVGSRVKGKGPQTYIVEEVVPQTEAEKANDEQFYSVKNERTGETQVVEKADMKRVKKSAEGKRYNPLGYDIADVVEDVKAGKTDTPLRAVNQVIKESTEFRKRVKAESERRQQPRKRGKAAILERVARERSAGNITEKTAQALTDFVNRIREDAIGDTAISIREKGISNFEFADNLVTFFLNQDKGNLGREVAVHEFWHGLSRFLPEAEVEQINKDYVRELEAYLKKNPWFLAFVGRYTLTPEQYEAYKFFNPKEAETKLTPILDDRGNIIKYKIKFDKDNYRYIMLDEFIAEKMTDLVLGKQAIPDTFLGKLAKAFREFLALIKTKLGIDPYEKFYQLVTDTNERLTLQRESGVAPPIQIYEPQEYDYSTRRMMAVEPTPIEPEAKTITEGLVQGIDIGKENNMPINNKIESHIKNFAFVRGIFESASDRLRRAKFTKLATAIDDYYDQAQRRLGFANKILLPAFDEYSKQSKSTKKRIDEEVKMFFAAQENKRDTDEFFDELNPITQKIVTAWQKFGEESGKENQRIGIKVFDRGLQRWRPIGKVEKFWPRVLKPEYKRALMEPDKYQKEYNEIVEALMKSGRINTPEEAEVFISDYQGTGSQNDYFSGIEAARGQAFPEELYDYSMQVMTDYVARWAQHSSRIEQFGQKLGENSKTLWDRSRESTRDRRTIDYITAAQERVEGYYPNDPIVKGMATLNIWSSGLQLGNPASSMLNFFGGTTLNAMVGQPGAFSSYLSSFVELRKLGRELKDAREKGIVSRDLMNIVGDHQVVLDSSGLAKAGQKTTDFLLKWSGFTPIEQMVRTQSMIIGKSFLRKTLSSLSKNPNSSFSKRALTWLNRNNIDADKLIVEQGTGPETDRLLRYFANISQGSYTIAQTPIFTDTPIGRFLFKYQKFSTQVMRQSWKNTFEPAWRAVTNKNETLQLPDPTRQLLYRLRLAEAKELGDNRKITLDEIPKKVTKAEGKALTIIPVMMWLGSAYVGGEVILRLRDMLFGVLMKGPDYEDIIRAFEDDEDDDELYLSLERAWYNLIGMGALGLIGNYAQFFMDWQDRERVKNPLDPPALSIFKETAIFIQNAVDQGKITVGDVNNYLNRTFSAYRVSQRLYQTAASGLGYSDAPTVAEEMFRREVASINKYARRWAESAGLEYRTKRPMDIAPSKMTSINREIANYLQRGEPGAAVAYAKEYLNSLPKKERANAIQSMESGARNRQPLRLGSGPMDQAEKIAFKKWLKEKVSKEKFDEIQKLDSQYQKNYNIFLNNLPNK